MSSTVSVGIPVYNGARYLARCLQSLQRQTHDDLEIVISDNASDDDSLRIARTFAAEDTRIRVLTSDTNRGAAWNYNRVVHESAAPFFCWNAHDDEREPTAIANYLDAFERHGPDVVLTHDRGVFIDENSEVVAVNDEHFEIPFRSRPRRLATALQNLNVANPVMGLIRRDALERTRLIGPFAASDYVLLAELAILGPIVEVPELGFRRRTHPESSRAAATSRDAVQAWFDPTRRGSRLSDRTRLLLEYHRSAWRLAPTVPAKLTTGAVIVPARATKRARVVAGALKERLTTADGQESSPDRGRGPERVR